MLNPLLYGYAVIVSDKHGEHSYDRYSTYDQFVFATGLGRHA